MRETKRKKLKELSLCLLVSLPTIPVKHFQNEPEALSLYIQNEI